MIPRNDMFGREMIFSDVNELTDENITDVLNQALAAQAKNHDQIDYLWKYYRGNQPILERIKEVRPEITNKIVENRANQIVSFKTGYVYGEPVQYVARNTDESVAKGISELNEMMLSLNKPALDKEIADWRNISGTGYRMILPSNDNFTPFNIYTLDPRDTFVVYSTDIDKHPLFGVKVSYKTDIGYIYSVYSNNWFWRIENTSIVESKPHLLGDIPIIEYPLNLARLGAFEPVLPQLDMLNNIDSNRMDGLEQTIQSFIKFINCDIDEEGFAKMRAMGAIKVKSTDGQNADVDVVNNDLNQDQSQTIKNDTYESVLTICGLPNRNGGSSTSDTGAAVQLRDGWSDAEARAKDDELMFKRSETQMLKIALNIIQSTQGLDESLYSLRLRDIGMQFTRRNYDNIQSKSQVLISMLNNNKIHPRLAFIHSGLFSDPEDAYQQSMRYYEEMQRELQEQAQETEEIIVDEE